MPSLSTSELQPLPSFSTPIFFLRPPSPISTTSSWLGAGGRKSREAGAGQRRRAKDTERQDPEAEIKNVVWKLTEWLDVYFTVTDEFEMPSKKHLIVPACSLPRKGGGDSGSDF